MELLIKEILQFCKIYQKEILGYFKRVYSYIKDLFVYRKIDLDLNFKDLSEEKIIETIKTMRKITNIGLNTIGVPKEILSELSEMNFEIYAKIVNEYGNPDAYFERELKSYIKSFLLPILLEYLLNLDNSKVRKLELFDLFPRKFIEELDQFRKRYIYSLLSNLSLRDISEIESYLNFSELLYSIEKPIEISKGDAELIEELSQDLNSIKDATNSEKEIIIELEQAIKESLDALKAAPPKELAKLKPIEKIEVTVAQNLEKTLIKKEPLILTQTNTFLDTIGDTSNISKKIINKFTIDNSNLVNCRIENINYFDLGNLFYYVSIFKMLNIKDSFAPHEILEVLKKFVNNKVFSSSNFDVPDSKSNFFGLAILSEYNLLAKANFFDPFEIKLFLRNELKNFMPEKLNFNFYSLMCLKLLKKKEGFHLDKDNLLNSIIDFELSKQEEYNPTLDMFYKLGTIKLLDKDVDLTRFKALYLNELKRIIKPDGSITDTVTDSARGLLVIDLLDTKDQAVNMCNGLLNYIFESSDYFASESLKNEFNWKTDEISFKIELRTLFWALLACSQFTDFV